MGSSFTLACQLPVVNGQRPDSATRQGIVLRQELNRTAHGKWRTAASGQLDVCPP